MNLNDFQNIEYTTLLLTYIFMLCFFIFCFIEFIVFQCMIKFVMSIIKCLQFSENSASDMDSTQNLVSITQFSFSQSSLIFLLSPFLKNIYKLRNRSFSGSCYHHETMMMLKSFHNQDLCKDCPGIPSQNILLIVHYSRATCGVPAGCPPYMPQVATFQWCLYSTGQILIPCVNQSEDSHRKWDGSIFQENSKRLAR